MRRHAIQSGYFSAGLSRHRNRNCASNWSTRSTRRRNRSSPRRSPLCSSSRPLFALSGDSTYAWIFVGFLAVSIGRAVSIVALPDVARTTPTTAAATTMWERRALVGAWAFACLVGFTGAYTVTVHPNSDIELLVNSCVMGYIAGISSRNASRPIISIGQVSLTAVPFLIALVARFDLVHSVLAVFHRRAASQHHRHLPGGVREHHFPP